MENDSQYLYISGIAQVGEADELPAQDGLAIQPAGILPGRKRDRISAVEKHLDITTRNNTLGTPGNTIRFQQPVVPDIKSKCRRW